MALAWQGIWEWRSLGRGALPRGVGRGGAAQATPIHRKPRGYQWVLAARESPRSRKGSRYAWEGPQDGPGTRDIPSSCSLRAGPQLHLQVNPPHLLTVFLPEAWPAEKPPGGGGFRSGWPWFCPSSMAREHLCVWGPTCKMRMTHRGRERLSTPSPSCGWSPTHTVLPRDTWEK